MEIEIIKLIEKNNDIFNKICNWQYNWWGKRDNNTIEEVVCYMEHSLFENKIPQTFVALYNNTPVGMYQISMSDDLQSRPDIYPWLVNVFVDENYRNIGICKKLMQSVKENAKSLNLCELFLYTRHKGLYEKFGWQFIEEVNTYRESSPIERLYRLKIN